VLILVSAVAIGIPYEIRSFLNKLVFIPCVGVTYPMSQRNWTPEQRQRQRELIQRWKPWEKSTGAKTPEGKKRSARNSYKTGKSLEVRELIKAVNKVLKEQRDLLFK
jgi:hypothetical protein